MSKKIPIKGGSSSQIKNTSKTIEENILDIIHEISKKQYSYDFRIPVDVKALGLNDYYDIVIKPMDLTTLKNNFLDGEYKTVQDVWDAFDLIVTNCKAYNRLPEHPINAKADQMKARVDKAFQKLIEDFVAIDVDIKGYQLQVDHSELKAKEEKKRKVKLDGLDEKNILMGTDKRQQIAPGSLNEKKLFDLQNPENQIQMMPQQRQASIMSQSQSLQEENLFQPNQLKSLGASMLQIPQKMEIENNQGSQSIKTKKIEKEKELEAKKQRKLFLLGKQKQFKEILQNAKQGRSQLQHSYSEFLRKEAKILSDSNEEIKRISGGNIKRNDEEDLDDIVIKKKGNGFDDCTSETARSQFTTPIKQDKADSVISKNFESDEEEEFKPKELQVIKQTNQKTSTSTIKSDLNGQLQEKKQLSVDKPKKTEGGGYSGQNSVSKSQISGGQTNGEVHKKKEDLSHHKVKLLPAAPELKKNQSQMAAQIIQMGQEKKNRELEELKKSEEQKKLDEKLKRERILKKKEQRLLQEYQNKNNLKEEMQNNALNNSNNLIKIPMNNNTDKTQNLKTTSNNINGINLNPKATTSGSTPTNISNSDFNKIRIPNTVGINSQQALPNLQQIQPGTIPQTTSSDAVNSSSNVVLIPQISIGGERLDFKFSFDRKSLKSRYDNMIIRKQEKYKKILNTNLEKMQQVTSWMIIEWDKLKKPIKSETLLYFRDILNERVKIKDNLDIRKIQLLLKMFLYRLRDFYKELKEDQIEKLKIFSEKMYKIASRAIVYKTPLPFRDNPLNAGFDIQVSNTVILEETHPLKKLQEETLEIEREMKYFRRMLQRDIQKYQETQEQQQTDTSTTHMNKIGTKKKTKEEGGQFNEPGESDITGYQQIQNNNAAQGYGDSREMGGLQNADKDVQQQQSELLQFFIDQNKVFESKISDLSRIRMFLHNEQANIQDDEREKGKFEHDICETYMEDSDQNQVELIEYIKKKRKLNKKDNNNYSSGKWQDNNNEEDGQGLLKKEEESSSRLEEEDVDYDKEENTTGGQGSDQVNKNVDITEEKQMANFEFELNISSGMQQKDKTKQNSIEECRILMESSCDEEEYNEQENQKYLAYQQVLTEKNKQIQFHQCSNDDTESQLKLSNFEFPKQSLKCLNAQPTHYLDQFYEKIPFNPLHLHPEYVILEADQFELVRVQLVTSDLPIKENLPALIHHLTQKMPRASSSSIIRQFNLQGIVQFLVKLKVKVQKRSENGKNNDDNAVNSKQIPRNHNQVHNSPIKVNLKNTLTKISEAYMAESLQINQSLLADCSFNQSDYSSLCPEDVEAVVLGLPPRISFKDFQTNSSNRGPTEYLTSQYYHNPSGCNLSSKMEAPDRRKEDRIQTLTAEINIVIPFVSIYELELSINNYSIFNPMPLRQLQRR